MILGLEILRDPTSTKDDDDTLTFVISPQEMFIWKDFQRNSIAVRCLYPSGWYLKYIENNITYLSDIIKESKKETIYLIGTSAGAYASILYASILANDSPCKFVSIAFGPQTLIYPPSKNMEPFRVYDNFVEDMKDEMDVVNQYCDLKEVLNINLNPNHKTIHVYGERNPEDTFFFHHIETCDNVVGLPIDYEHHDVWLKYHPTRVFELYED